MKNTGFPLRQNECEQLYINAENIAGQGYQSKLSWSSDVLGNILCRGFLSHYSLSDHILLTFSLPLFCPNDELHIQPGQRFSYCKADYNGLREDIRNSPFTPICYSNCDKMLDECYKWINSKLIKYVPVRTKFRSTLSPWISSSTSHKIKQLNTAKKHHKNVFHLEDIVNDMISHDFTSYQEKVISSRDTHLHFKSLRNSNRLPEKMHFNDVELTSPAKKADCINSFFHSVYLPCDDKSGWFPPRSIDGSAFSQHWAVVLRLLHNIESDCILLLNAGCFKNSWSWQSPPCSLQGISYRHFKVSLSSVQQLQTAFFVSPAVESWLYVSFIQKKDLRVLSRIIDLCACLIQPASYLNAASTRVSSITSSLSWPENNTVLLRGSRP